jgi:hypothetical protein
LNRSQIEHILRAASGIVGDSEFIIIGSQAVLGQFPAAPAKLIQSIEVDLYPKNKPASADLIDGAIGELSVFHETFGYYAHCVDEKTASLPRGWKKRLVPIRNANTRGATGWCLEIHDLVASKYAAGRQRDRDFNHEALRAGMVDPTLLRKRINTLPLSKSVIRTVLNRFDRDTAV